jgi:ABC-type tungstate transport system substrate-binding protein
MGLAARSLLVALIATAVSGFPMAVLVTLDIDQNLRLVQGIYLVFISLLGNLLIGLPTALLLYRLVWRSKEIGLCKLLVTSNAIAIVLAIILLALSGTFGLLLLGFPIFLAANTFAVVGWFLVVKPQQYKIQG